MDVWTAKTLLCAIAAVGAAVWLLSLRNWIVARRRQGSGGEYDQRSGKLGPRGQSVVGSVELDEEPEALLDKLVSVLATGSFAGFSLVSIVDRGDSDVVFEIQGWTTQGGGSGPPVQGRVSFRRAASGRTCAEYQAYVASRGGLMIAAAAVQAFGLVALVGGFSALWTFVATSESPQVRLQVLQMLQVVHFLWPPFLFVFVHRRLVRVVDTALKTLLRNLPYLNS